MISYSGQHHGEYLCAFLKEHKAIQLNVGVEVGVRFGDTTEYLLTNFPPLTLYVFTIRTVTIGCFLTPFAHNFDFLHGNQLSS